MRKGIDGQYPTKPSTRRNIAVHCTISQAASLIRRSAWDAIGGLDESIQRCMDYDLLVGLSRIGRLVISHQFCRSLPGAHAQSKTRTQRKEVKRRGCFAISSGIGVWFQELVARAISIGISLVVELVRPGPNTVLWAAGGEPSKTMCAI